MTLQQSQMLEELYRETYMPLVMYAYSALQNKELAEELAQDTFSVACVKINELEASPNRQGWLMNALKHLIRNYRHTMAVRSKIVGSVLDVDSVEVGVKDDISFAVSYHGVLSDDDFLLLKFTAQYGFTIEEAALLMGISKHACAKRLQRAKEKLRRNL